MNRTDQVIKYLEEYKHHCYIRGAGAEHYRSKFKELDKLIKELKEHGCRRTVDA